MNIFISKWKKELRNTIKKNLMKLNAIDEPKVSIFLPFNCYTIVIAVKIRDHKITLVIIQI